MRSQMEGGKSKHASSEGRRDMRNCSSKSLCPKRGMEDHGGCTKKTNLFASH